MTKLVFVHGWGFDPVFWDGVCKALPEQKCVRVDLGFFNDAQGATGDVYITHSMGLAWTLKFAKPKAIIAINGFTRFCASDDWLDGVHPRMLSRMIKQFERNPDKVWCDFMKNSGMSDPVYPQNANKDALIQGLKNLADWDVRDAFQSFKGPKLMIAGQEDRIVPEKLTTASFAEEVIWYKQGHHLLPLSDASSIAGHIKSFLDRLRD